MIHKLRINNFGSLINFSNDQDEFDSVKTVIHGMNGCGKSQICTMLRQVEKLKNRNFLDPNKMKEEEKNIAKYIHTRISKELSSTIVSIEIDNYSALIDTEKNKITENGVVPDIFIFNDDYTNENIGDLLQIHDKEIKIGQKNVQRDNLIHEKQEKERALKNINNEIDKIVDEARIDSGYPEQTRTKNIISKENYLNKKNPSELYPNGKNELNNLSNPPDLIVDHHRYTFPSLLLDDIIKNAINDIMTKPYIEPRLTHEFYKTYLTIKKEFYEDGIFLFNKSKNICPFCLMPKSEDDSIIKELIGYLNSDFNDKSNRIKSLIELFKQKKQELKLFISSWNTLIPIIRDKSKSLSIVDEIEDIFIEDDIINTCIDLLNTKLRDMNNIIGLEKLCVFEEYENYINNVKSKYQQHINKIDNINNKIDQISSLKRSLGEKIIKNQMYMLWEKNNLRERYEQLTNEIDNLKIEIDKSSSLISNNRIPDFFNQIIKILGIVKYELSKESLLILKLENEFDISKEGYRISAGERRIIAFSYFLAEVLATAMSDAELLQKTIIIDDPIDSSDYDKFYSFISVIEKFDNILINIFKNSSIKFGQIIIFTHSALLYERLINSNEIDYRLIELENNKTTIKKPKRKISLVTFSSYIRKITNYIKKMECSNTKEIGNYIRRVLEIVCSVENIDSNKITNVNASSKLNALANHLSHESIERILDPLPVSCEYIEACIELIEEIRIRMPYLYNSIVEKYFKGNQIDHYRTEYNKKYLRS